jgi:hypothetical protein
MRLRQYNDRLTIGGIMPPDSNLGLNMGLYSHYDGAHNHPVNRALHVIAIPVGFSSLIVVWWHWVMALLLIPTAFALAWLGHWIEGNKPAFLTNPIHVFIAPLWLARKIFRVAPNVIAPNPNPDPNPNPKKTAP